MSGQLWLPIDYVPQQLQSYGYSDAHVRPLVSRGKRLDGGLTSFRLPAGAAWHGNFPSIELRTPISFPTITHDLDYAGAFGLVYQRAYLDNLIPPPSFMVERPENGHGHVSWVLPTPVHRGIQARGKPQWLYRLVSSWLADVLGADPGFGYVLTHNPAFEGEELRTHWLNPHPLGLLELADWIEASYIASYEREQRAGRTYSIDLPSYLIDTYAGERNNALFAAGLRFIARSKNLGAPVLPYLFSVNAQYMHPAEQTQTVIAKAKLLEGYRRKNLKEGWYYYTTPEEGTAKAHAGRLKGLRRTRQPKSQQRALEVQRLLRAGWTQIAIAQKLTINPRTVYRLKQKLVQTPLP